MLFKDLSLIEPLLRALESVGYEQPTPIQEQAIPIVLSKQDLLGCAQTGTGKTAAFALPMLQLLFEEKPAGNHRPIRALILTPTRELAIQIAESFTDYGKNLHLKNQVIFGGVNQYGQTEALKRKPEILIATPGRLLDLMNQGFVSLKDIEIFVLDEADRMLDMGFIHDVKKVIAKLPTKRQTLFFSATMPQEISSLANSILTNPQRVEVTPVSSTAEKVEQAVYFVEKQNKKHLLAHLLEDKTIRSALVFTRTKHGANKVTADLVKAGIHSEAIHGNKSQNARQAALKNFKTGRTRVLVATDIAARGIDIDELSHVVNYELPNVPETYVHRIGRTGRAGLSGMAISFCEAEEVPYLRDIQKLIGQVVPVVLEHPYVADLSAPSAPQPAQRRPQQREPRPFRQQGKPQLNEARERGPRQERPSGRPQGPREDRRSNGEGQPREERRPNQQGAPRDERRPQQRDERRPKPQGQQQPQRDERRPKQQQAQPNRTESNSGSAESTLTRRNRFASILEVATIQKQERPPKPRGEYRDRNSQPQDQQKREGGNNRFGKNKRNGRG